MQVIKKAELQERKLIAQQNNHKALRGKRFEKTQEERERLKKLKNEFKSGNTTLID